MARGPRHDLIYPARSFQFNSRTDVGLLAGALISGHRLCHLLRRVLAYIEPHIRIRADECGMFLTTHAAGEARPARHTRGADLARRHRVPIVIPTAPPWHSRKQSFDGFPGDGATTIPELVYTTLSLSVPPSGLTISRRGDRGIHICVRCICSPGYQDCPTNLPTSQAHCHLMIKLILETSRRIDQFRFERTLWRFTKPKSFANLRQGFV